MQPRCPVFNLFKRFWECQDRPNPACVPDLRICPSFQGLYRPCHGIVTLGKFDLTEGDIIGIIKAAPLHTARLVLERESNNVYHVQRILQLADAIHKAIPDARLDIIAKAGWERLQTNLPNTRTLYLNYEQWRTDLSFWQNVKRLFSNWRLTPRAFSKMANKNIKPEYYSSQDFFVEVDFI